MRAIHGRIVLATTEQIRFYERRSGGPATASAL